MQEFRVVKCAECNLYQVDIVKKVPKWTCKVCNCKQSVKLTYFKAFNAKDCRDRAQQMNTQYHEKRLESEDKILDRLEDAENAQTNQHEEFVKEEPTANSTVSKYAKFANLGETKAESVLGKQSLQNEAYECQNRKSVSEKSSFETTHKRPKVSSESLDDFFLTKEDIESLDNHF